jgi:dihydroceramidase
MNNSIIHGYWGAPTASIDWCEANYLHNQYIAETFNTVSNAFYLVTSLGSMYRTYRSVQGQSKLSQWDMARFYLLYLFGLTVCIGSFMFHATLLKSFQLLDELPMLYR